MRRLLTPREHGTYAQLAFPILSGLLLGRPGPGAFLLAAAVTGIFLAYEPVAVLTGTRGARLLREEARAARRQLAVLGPLAAGFGAAGVIALPSPVRWLVLVPAGVAALLLPLLLARRVKSLAGETVVAAALAAVHAPLAAAGGVTGPLRWGPALVWFAGFFLATLAVHAIKARHKRRHGWIVAAAFLAPGAAALAALFLALTVPSLRVLAGAAVPPIGAVLVVNVMGVHPRALKRVGWTLVTANAATLLIMAWR